MLLEPPRVGVVARALGALGADAELGRPLTSAVAAVAAIVLAVAGKGDVVVLAVVLGVAQWRVIGAFAAAGALAAAAIRWGTPSLSAIGGAQAVLGSGATVGGRGAIGALTCAALALVLLARRQDAPPVAVALGSAAALLVAGPSGTDAASLAIRLVAATAVGALSWFAAARGDTAARVRTGLALVLAGAGIALAVIG